MSIFFFGANTCETLAQHPLACPSMSNCPQNHAKPCKTTLNHTKMSCMPAHARLRMSLHNLGYPHTLMYAMHAHACPRTPTHARTRPHTPAHAHTRPHTPHACPSMPMHARACLCMILVAHTHLYMPCMPAHAPTYLRIPVHACACPHTPAHARACLCINFVTQTHLCMP